MSAKNSHLATLTQIEGSKPRRPNDYCVPPLLVNDLETQCAAHFMAWFSTNTVKHVRDVLKCGIHRSGGLVEEVDYWFDYCASDASSNGNNLGYWDVSVNGPWVYETLAVADIAHAVRRHTKGWSARDFALYGYTLAEKESLDKAVAKFN